jgi:hypothetical protein
MPAEASAATTVVEPSPTAAGSQPRVAGLASTLPGGAAPGVATPILAVAATATPFVPPLVGGRPAFSDVSQVTPSDAVAFLAGRNSRYPGSDPAKVSSFSPSDILETMDTAILDEVRQGRGDAALRQVYEVVARDVLATLRDVASNRWMLVALDAGHGGNKSYFWDPGSNGTEALHTRAVVDAIGRLAAQPDNARIIVRRIFNDAIADDFGIGTSPNRRTIESILMRQVRAAMLALEARAWNAAHPDPASQVDVQEVSVHFNSGAGGALVLHEGSDVSPEFQARSLEFGQRYLRRVVPDLNATGLLPSLLTLWGGDGLHDDIMMYRPNYMNGSGLPSSFVPRYGELQGSTYTPRLIQNILKSSTLLNTA